MKINRGFTLIELLAVIAILALLVLISVPLVTRYVNNARNFSNETILHNAEDAAVNYGMENAKLSPNDAKSTFIQNNNAITYTLDDNNYASLASNKKKLVKIKTLIEQGYFKDDAEKLKRDGDVIIYKYKGSKKTSTECQSSNADSCYNFELKAFAPKALIK